MSHGNTILAALKQSCATASAASWLGQSPCGDLVFVTRASCVTNADMAAMVRACQETKGVHSVRYEVDCGDRAVRIIVKLADPATPTARAAAFATVAFETAAFAWSCRVLGWV